MKELEGLEDQIGDAVQMAEEIPFGQSAFQNIYLADDADTPERKLRYVLLQLRTKIGAMRELEYRRRRLDVDMRERRAQLEKEQDQFQRERLEIDLEEKTEGLESSGKLIRDCVIEIRTFLAMLEKLPRDVTRARFEEAERGYWTARLTKAAELEYASTGTVSAGTLDALAKVGLEAKVKVVEGQDPQLLLEGKLATE